VAHLDRDERRPRAGTCCDDDVVDRRCGEVAHHEVLAEVRERVGTPQVHEAERHERVLASLAERMDVEPALERGRELRREEAVALAMGLDAREG
jgi:hypothetical protein